MTADSKPAPPKPAGPGPKPSGPTRPGMPSPAGPRVGDTDLLDVIDAQLIALIALAHFGPAEQGTSESVRQACAAEVLMHRLRMARRAVADLRAAFETTRPPGEEPTPGSAAAVAPAARESTGAGNSTAGADVPAVRARGEGRAVGAGGAATFTVPDTRRPLRFDEGEHRLVGRIAIGTGPQYDSLRWSR